MEEYQAKKIYKIKELGSKDNVAQLESMLRKTEGINAGEVLADESIIKIVFDKTMISESRIKAEIVDLGFEILSEV